MLNPLSSEVGIEVSLQQVGLGIIPTSSKNENTPMTAKNTNKKKITERIKVLKLQNISTFLIQ